jgi:predicted MFS family arabinose efflux permease
MPSSSRCSATAPKAPQQPQRLSRLVVTLLAITCGAAVANLYYIQPLLNEVSSEFGLTDTTAGLLVTASQVGYLVGIALLVPVGDLVERRRLIVTLLVIATGAAALIAAAPGYPVLLAGLVAVGLLAALAQIVVPLASTLAGPDERGQVVGTVMSGMLIGILIARTVSGLISEIGGWRLVFAVAAALMLLLAVVLARALPLAPPPADMTYPKVLRSVLVLIRDEPVLRQRMALGALGFACFSILWTAIAFLLGDHYGYGEGVIGLFGLAGIAGALIAPLAGRVADKGHGRAAMTVFLLGLLASWGLLALGGTSIVALVAGIVLLDLGMNGAHISNQATIYALEPEARSRITTAYMVAMFLGGVVGSLAAAAVYGAAGWGATCGLGAGMAALALAVWALTQRAVAAPVRSPA